MGNYRDLEVWKEGREVAVLVYGLTQSLPAEEKFGLISQIRRAAVSIPANIAEGAGLKTDPNFAARLKIALGSLFELETLLILCVDLGYLAEADTADAMTRLRRLGIKIQNLGRSIQASARERLRQRTTLQAIDLGFGEVNEHEANAT